MAHQQKIGQWGEETARDYLIERGLQLVDRNARTPYGELDLILKDGNQLVFVEVKTRTSTTMGLPETSMTEEKITHLVDAVEHYLLEHSELDDNWRVDVVTVIGRPDGSPAQIDWFVDALV